MKLAVTLVSTVPKAHLSGHFDAAVWSCRMKYAIMLHCRPHLTVLRGMGLLRVFCACLGACLTVLAAFLTVC